ncbi:OmpA family protein [Candidatus Thiosymbion oneisti]|uniref:OmpA family protein n=1 Tax=Candidatus Thiosymbion oneisti TaxID=589554 RepID=UPI000B7DD20C|nr:OmpA family protein [Candidatus Thiosymbion oneisti]
MNKSWMKPGATLFAGSLLLVACATDEYGNRRPLTETQAGAAIGVITGAAVGAAVADKSAKGAVIGAVGGGLAGGLIGHYMEQQRRDFEKLLAPEIAAGVIRVKPLPDDRLLVGMTSETTFEIDSDRIKPGFHSTLDKISGVVNKYGKTRLTIAGHTDSTGSAAHNQGLSERRAQAVEGYLLSESVYPGRLSAIGYGEDQPITSNETEESRRRNRRVDITIIPITTEQS